MEQYKNFDKVARDALKDDYEKNLSLKVKTTTIHGVEVNSTIEHVPSIHNTFPSKVCLKWASPNGFAIDKFEMSSVEKGTLETSLNKIPNVPGLKLTFKGVDASNGTVGAIYKHSLATIASDLDVTNFSGLNASVLGGTNGFLAGGTVSVALGGKVEAKDYGAAIGYSQQNVFVGVKSMNKFADFSGALHAQVKPGLDVSALVDFNPQTTAHKVSAGISYQCTDLTTSKVKATSDGTVHASLKHCFPNNLVVNGAIGVDVQNPSAYSFGVSATLG